MRCFVFQFCALLILNCFLVAQSPDIPLLRQLIEKLKQGMPAPYRNEPASYMEGSKWQEAPEYGQLQNAIRTNWPGVLASFAKSAPDSTSQTILILCAQTLPVDDYVQFMSETIDMADKKIIFERRLIDWGLRPAEKHLRNFLMQSYQDPKIRTLIGKAKELFADDPMMTSYFDNILSGKVKKDYDAYVAEWPNAVVAPPSGDPLDAKRVWPPQRADQRTPTGEGGSASNSDTDTHLADVGKADESAPLPGGWALWAGFVVVLAAAGWLFLRGRESRRGP